MKMIRDDKLKKVLKELIEKGYMIKNPENPHEYSLTEKGFKQGLAKGLGTLSKEMKVPMFVYCVWDYIKQKETKKGLKAIGVC